MRSRNLSPNRSILSCTRPVSIRSVPKPSTMPKPHDSILLHPPRRYHTIWCESRDFNRPTSKKPIVTAPYPAGHMTTVPARPPHASPSFSDEHSNGNQPSPRRPYTHAIARHPGLQLRRAPRPPSHPHLRLRRLRRLDPRPQDPLPLHHGVPRRDPAPRRHRSLLLHHRLRP